MNKTLLNEVREVKRKISLPIVRKGSRGELVPPKFTERETEFLRLRCLLVGLNDTPLQVDTFQLQ